ncbi:WD40-repeat-containing protein [Penicillium ucsense]|uniref:WD40-repeat-containing protein n=1 Tax=Penicillium ucsense TaxID=2839758 RepID=A0A8J8W0V2_9EURO|nr:WD40-repeat-containing protein [Penicillium ucsense]KAF7726643.1 WD40-repeat-containing protein [Penicillium ucsense]
MNSYLLNRALGSVLPKTFHTAHTTQLVHNLEPAPGIRFSNRRAAPKSKNQDERDGTPFDEEDGATSESVVGHPSGVNCLAIDQFEGRYMVSGGADPSIHLWDLESRGSDLHHIHRACATVSKSSHKDAHTHAITSLSIYPFDPVPSTIFSTSHDCTLKLSALEPPGVTPVHTFNLDCTPYAHSFSSQPGSTLLVAVATSEHAVRLVDLRSGLATQGLPGHNAAVLSVAWAPHRPHLLASGSVDNRVIIFDVRRGGHNSAIATLDMDDPVGLVVPGSGSVPESFKSRAAFSRNARAHNGPVTGVRWTSNGSHIVTTGQDSRIRVWDSGTGANTLAHFGPRVRNSSTSHLAERAPLLVPKSFTGPGQETLLWPNFNEQDDRGEIFMFELREGTYIKRLRVPGLMTGSHVGRGRASALSGARINDLAWRGNGASGEGAELFSAHGDGTIRAWVSRQPDDEPDEEEEAELADRKRKREVLDELYRGFVAPEFDLQF